MLKFAHKGFSRAVLTRSVSAPAAAAPAEAAAAPASGELSVLENNIWFVNSTSPSARVVGFKWTPGLWARAKVESAETNKELLGRIKSADVTTRDLFHLTGVGLTMWAAFLVGDMIGKWKIFGHRGKEPHHGHGMWTDTPVGH